MCKMFVLNEFSDFDLTNWKIKFCWIIIKLLKVVTEKCLENKLFIHFAAFYHEECFNFTHEFWILIILSM